MPVSPVPEPNTNHEIHRLHCRWQQKSVPHNPNLTAPSGWSNWPLPSPPSPPMPNCSGTCGEAAGGTEEALFYGLEEMHRNKHSYAPAARDMMLGEVACRAAKKKNEQKTHKG